MNFGLMCKCGHAGSDHSGIYRPVNVTKENPMGSKFIGFGECSGKIKDNFCKCLKFLQEGT